MILPEKAVGVYSCPYCGYAIWVGEWKVPVGLLNYHLECAEAHSNIEVDWENFHRLIDSGEL